jgi:shikimate kinase
VNIVLIGYRGTGKSTIAEILEEKLSMRVVGMDAEIVRRAGKSIPEVVEESGWDHFRDMESQVAADLGGDDELIIDAGGGVIVRPQNIESLKQNGIVFWLIADVETIVERIKDGTERPSLSGSKSFVDEVAEILEEREPKYKAAADHTIDTANNPPQEAAQTIADIFAASRR